VSIAQQATLVQTFVFSLSRIKSLGERAKRRLQITKVPTKPIQRKQSRGQEGSLHPMTFRNGEINEAGNPTFLIFS
jgi:hypothetical protein